MLRDPHKRIIYDRYGHQGVEGTGYTGFSGFDDIFSSFGDIFEDLFEFATPKKKARKAVKSKIRNSGATPAKAIMSRINQVLTGWVNYFRVGNSSRAFSEVRDYVKMKVRTLLTRRKRRQKRSIGWRRWSNEYLYGVLGLYWDWKIHPLKGAECYK